MISEILLPKKKREYIAACITYSKASTKNVTANKCKKKKKSFCIKYVKVEPKFSGVNPDSGLNSPLAPL